MKPGDILSKSGKIIKKGKSKKGKKSGKKKNKLQGIGSSKPIYEKYEYGLSDW